MKSKIIYLFLFFIAFSTINSCRKVEEEIVDCLGESISTSLRHHTDDNNPKIVNYEIHYIGDKAVTSIAWDFGDGTKMTTTNKTISHTYTSSGTFEVKADVNIWNGKCIVYPKKSITVQ